jgi:hypothetical protein
MKTATKSNEYTLVSDYKWGYRNLEDVTNLVPGVMITGSQNVFTNVSSRIEARKGYVVDGQVNNDATPITASFDWDTMANGERNMRAGFLTSAGNDGKLQYRYVDSTGTVTWRDLITGASSVAYNFCTFWNETEVLRECLFVNGSSQIQAWNGAVTTLLSATATTITKDGTDTWGADGFYTSANKSVVINGTTYTYTGGEGTTTLTGVSPSPAAEAVGSVVHQAVVTTANSAITGLLPTFANGVIGNLENHIYLGALNSATYYISRQGSYTNYSYSTPRVVGEGWKQTIDENVVAFIPQNEQMYISAGKNSWYKVTFSLQTSAVGVTYEQVNAPRLKTGRQQGALSQAFVSHMKNDIIMVSNESTVDRMGVAENFLTQNTTQNTSDPIKLDVDSYDFTDGSIFYFRYNIYVAVPREGLVLIYDVDKQAWQAPQVLPISRFYIVNGELYGHSYNTSESYKLFTGYSDRAYSGFAGYPIAAKIVFSYQNYGSPATLKKANSLYIEGYVNTNTTITAKITYELDGCSTQKSFEVVGSDKQVVCIPASFGSLGKTSLGKQKLGGTGTTSIQGLPPKFRVEKTFSNTDFFECSVSFEILGVDQNFQLIRFGLNASQSPQSAVFIRQ